MMNPRRRPSDASSNYSGSTGSVWSTTGSVSFVYTYDPDWNWWGYEGVRGAVTRKEDKEDDRRVRFAAHFLRGPFGKLKSKKHSSRHHDSHRRRDSDSRSDYSSSSSSSHSSSSRGHFSRGSSPIPPPPPHGYSGSPYPHGPPPPHPPPPHHPGHYDDFPLGPPIGMRPPPPPQMACPPAHSGFEAGFIEINRGGGPPASHDPVWGHDAHYRGEAEVWP
ncbi:hypothetical protein F5B17DRAFT_35502 [Nemania serpens]|nr:hypothetical protein F5B17DRAFT_35502 [Nemania serpens]